jgi:hypothetical protein
MERVVVLMFCQQTTNLQPDTHYETEYLEPRYNSDRSRGIAPDPGKDPKGIWIRSQPDGDLRQLTDRPERLHGPGRDLGERFVQSRGTISHSSGGQRRQ